MLRRIPALVCLCVFVGLGLARLTMAEADDASDAQIQKLEAENDALRKANAEVLERLVRADAAHEVGRLQAAKLLNEARARERHLAASAAEAAREFRRKIDVVGIHVATTHADLHNRIEEARRQISELEMQLDRTGAEAKRAEIAAWVGGGRATAVLIAEVFGRKPEGKDEVARRMYIHAKPLHKVMRGNNVHASQLAGAMAVEWGLNDPATLTALAASLDSWNAGDALLIPWLEAQANTFGPLLMDHLARSGNCSDAEEAYAKVVVAKTTGAARAQILKVLRAQMALTGAESEWGVVMTRIKQAVLTRK